MEAKLTIERDGYEIEILAECGFYRGAERGARVGGQQLEPDFDEEFSDWTAEVAADVMGYDDETNAETGLKWKKGEKITLTEDEENLAIEALKAQD